MGMSLQLSMLVYFRLAVVLFECIVLASMSFKPVKYGIIACDLSPRLFMLSVLSHCYCIDAHVFYCSGNACITV